MIFNHTLEAVLDGRKTRTSRLAKPDDYTFVCGYRPMPEHPRGQVSLYSSIHLKSGRPRWVVGKDYAVQPDRGQKSVARIRVNALWRQDMRTITHEQAVAEGMEDRVIGGEVDMSVAYFFDVWTRMHDAEMHTYLRANDLWFCGVARDILMKRPAKLYTAWVIEFERIA